MRKFQDGKAYVCDVIHEPFPSEDAGPHLLWPGGTVRDTPLLLRRRLPPRVIEVEPSMGVKDYYSVMGLGPEASEDEIKKTYRKLVMQYHPDRNRNNPEAVETLKGINEAYHVLGDRERKSAYDQSLRVWTDHLPFRTYTDEKDLESFLSGLSARARFRGKGFCKRGGRGRCGKKTERGFLNNEDRCKRQWNPTGFGD